MGTTIALIMQSIVLILCLIVIIIDIISNHTLDVTRKHLITFLVLNTISFLCSNNFILTLLVLIEYLFIIYLWVHYWGKGGH